MKHPFLPACGPPAALNPGRRPAAPTATDPGAGSPLRTGSTTQKSTIWRQP